MNWENLCEQKSLSPLGNRRSAKPTGFRDRGFLKPILFGYKIKILTTTLGISFTEAYTNKKEVSIDGVPIKFIGLSGLIKNKSAVGRPKDLLDIENLPDLD